MGKSNKKVLDLKPEKISEEQLDKLQKIVTTLNKLSFDIGNLEVQKTMILRTVDEGKEELKVFQIELSEQYGVNQVDIQTGEIKYVDDDKPSDT